MLLSPTEVKWLGLAHWAGGVLRKTHSLRSFHSPGLSLGDVVWICVPTVERERPADLTALPGQSTRKSFGRLAQSPAVRAQRPYLMGSSVVALPLSHLFLWLVLTALAVTTSQWSTAILCFLPLCRHCTCSPFVPTFCAAHLHVIEGGCVCGLVIMFLNSPYEVELKAAS